MVDVAACWFAAEVCGVLALERLPFGRYCCGGQRFLEGSNVDGVLEAVSRAETAARIADGVAGRLENSSVAEVYISGVGRIPTVYLARAFRAYAKDLQETAWNMRHGEHDLEQPASPEPQAEQPAAQESPIALQRGRRVRSGGVE